MIRAVSKRKPPSRSKGKPKGKGKARRPIAGPAMMTNGGPQPAQSGLDGLLGTTMGQMRNNGPMTGPGPAMMAPPAMGPGPMGPGPGGPPPDPRILAALAQAMGQR